MADMEDYNDRGRAADSTPSIQESNATQSSGVLEGVGKSSENAGGSGPSITCEIKAPEGTEKKGRVPVKTIGKVTSMQDLLFKLDNDQYEEASEEPEPRPQAKRGRKRRVVEPVDVLKEKLEQLAVRPRVKTTKELLHELKMRNSSIGAAEGVQKSSIPLDAGGSLVDRNPRSSGLGVPSANPKREIILLKGEVDRRTLGAKPPSEPYRQSSSSLSDTSRSSGKPHAPKWYPSETSLSGKSWASVPSQHKNGSSSTSDLPEESPRAPPIVDVEEQIKTILSALPPIKPAEIEWEEKEHEVKKESPEEIENLSKRMRIEPIEGVNGNWSYENNRSVFREWHEPVIRPSYNGEPLTLFPYVITDNYGEHPSNTRCLPASDPKEDSFNAQAQQLKRQKKKKKKITSKPDA